MIRTWVARFRCRRELASALHALGYFCMTEFAHLDASDLVYMRVREAMKANPHRIRANILIDNQSPAQLALTAIALFCARELGSGLNHTHRGRLSMSGRAYLLLFDSALEQMVERGFLSAEMRSHWQADTAEAIQEAG